MSNHCLNLNLVHIFIIFIVGDLNVVRDEGERKWLSQHGTTRREINQFNEFIETLELFDIPMMGQNIHGIDQTGQKK